MKHRCLAATKLFELFHCDKNKPEFHNIYISSVNSKKILVLREYGWYEEEKEEFFFKVMDDCVSNISEYYSAHLDNYTSDEKKATKRMINYVDDMRNIGFEEFKLLDHNDDTKCFFREFMMDCQTMLCSNKIMIKTTIEKSKMRQKILATIELNEYKKRIFQKIKSEMSAKNN